MSVTGEIESDRQRIDRDGDLASLSRAQDAPAQGANTVVAATALGAKNDEQRIVILGSPAGGTFALKGLTTGGTPFLTALPWNATVAQVQAALRAILGAGEVFCFGTNILGVGGGVNRTMVVQFGTNGSADGTLIYTPIATMTADLSGLTGGGPHEFRNYHAAWGEPRYPVVAGTFYRLNTAQRIYALNVGGSIPPAGTVVTARQVRDRYVFTYG